MILPAEETEESVGTPTPSTSPSADDPPPVPDVPVPAATEPVVAQSVSDCTVTFSGPTMRRDGFVVPAGERWCFDPDATTTVTVTENVVVRGTLVMRPASPDVVHTLRFEGVDESRYRGGGMDVLDTDVGLWVMGVLDVRGTAKTAWMRLAGAASAGDASLTLAQEPSGWRAGDRLLVVPTARDATSPSDFEVRTIGAVEGGRVTLTAPLEADRPTVAGQTAEVANLTRNVVIEGTGSGSFDPAENGRAHVMVMSSQPQKISHAALRLLGPRHNTDGITKGRHITDGVLGRYPLHFHHMGDAARGSIIDGVVVEQSGNHAFVPHASHGVTIRNSVAYDVWEDAFWWDPPPERGNDVNDSYNIVWDQNLVAIVRDDPEFRGNRLAAFRLGDGVGSVLTNSVATGVQGSKSASGFHWPEHGHAVWRFAGNTAHNNRVNGIFVWQNDGLDHLIERFVAYHNGAAGIDHGAYSNDYVYRDVTLVGNGRAIKHLAVGREGGQTWQDVEVDDDVLIGHHNLPSRVPVTYINLHLADSRIVLDESDSGGVFIFRSTTQDRDLSPGDFEVRSCLSDVSVQNSDGSSFTVCR